MVAIYSFEHNNRSQRIDANTLAIKERETTVRYWEQILNEILNQRTGKNPHFQTTLTPTSKQASTTHPQKNKPKNSESYFLAESFPGIYLTQREAECMLNFLEEKTVTEAASHLNLSPRTVEFYLKNMKVKLECKTKSELVHKVRESDFSKNYLKTSDCESNN